MSSICFNFTLRGYNYLNFNLAGHELLWQRYFRQNLRVNKPLLELKRWKRQKKKHYGLHVHTHLVVVGYETIDSLDNCLEEK